MKVYNAQCRKFTGRGDINCTDCKATGVQNCGGCGGSGKVISLCLFEVFEKTSYLLFK